MAAVAELAHLIRSINELEAAIRVGMKDNKLSSQQQTIKSEIDQCMQRLDELRNKL